MNWRALLIRCALGGVFIYAGLPKALHPAAFLKSIESYQLVPYALAVLAAAWMPYVELAVGAACVCRIWERGAYALTGAMAAGFFGLHAYAWARGMTDDCGCFGPEGVWNSHPAGLVINAVLLAASLWLARQKNPVPPQQG
ncbi:MAG: DoxX family membrane protein [Opitutae bacterium]|nr:DoxX family membrane protein [Opitutae bacterium]